MVFIDTVDCCTAAVNAPATSGENEFATSVNVGLRPDSVRPGPLTLMMRGRWSMRLRGF
jgi:hypothetical protein